MALDYVRVADLIRLDLGGARAPRDARLCVDGLTPPPNHRDWQAMVGRQVAVTEYTVRSILGQALGRRDVASFGLGCDPAVPPGPSPMSSSSAGS